MTRNLKALGLALFAMFAMSAMAASAASAQETQDVFRSDGTDTYLTAEALNSQIFFASAGGENSIRCSEVNVDEATITGEEATEITVTPTYGGCRAFKNGVDTAAAKVTTNGCHYLFTAKTDVNKHAEVHITCPTGVTGITVDISALNTQCIHVIPQTVRGIHYDEGVLTGGVKDVTITATVTGIKSETTDHAVVCPTGAGTVEDTTGTYNGSVTVTGFSNASHTTRTSIWVEEL